MYTYTVSYCILKNYNTSFQKCLFNLFPFFYPGLAGYLAGVSVAVKQGNKTINFKMQSFYYVVLFGRT